MSMGGLEPPRISPHAPQACTSTIPPHRHSLFMNLSPLYHKFPLMPILQTFSPNTTLQYTVVKNSTKVQLQI